MTPKQAKFVQEYLIDCNATRSAIAAGYSKDTAYSQGQRMLKNVEIAQQIDRGLVAQQARTQITADRVLQEIALVAFADIKKIINEDGSFKRLRDMPEEMTRAISSIKFGEACVIKLVDKIKALELLAKHFNLLDRQNTDSIWAKQQEEGRKVEQAATEFLFSLSETDPELFEAQRRYAEKLTKYLVSLDE